MYRNIKGVRNVFGLSFHSLDTVSTAPSCVRTLHLLQLPPPPPAVSFPNNTHTNLTVQYYIKAALNSLENLNLYKTVCSVVAPGEQRANFLAPKSMTRNTLGFRINCNSFDFHTCLERNFVSLLFTRSIPEHHFSLLPLTSPCFIFVLIFTWASLSNKVFDVQVLVMLSCHEGPSTFHMHYFFSAWSQPSDLCRHLTNRLFFSVTHIHTGGSGVHDFRQIINCCCFEHSTLNSIRSSFFG